MNPEAIASWQRVITRMPVEQLFTESGPTRHARGELLASATVDALLDSSRGYSLVEACIGSPLRWYPRGDYGFWYHHARQRGAEPDNRRPLDDFPDSRCYFVSEWHDSERDDRVLLYEEHH